MKKKHLWRHELIGLFWGLITIYVGVALLLLLSLFIFSQLPGTIFPGQNISDLSLKNISPELIRKVGDYYSAVGAISIILLGAQAAVYTLSGWIIIKRSRIKLWYLAAVPAVVIILPGMLNQSGVLALLSWPYFLIPHDLFTGLLAGLFTSLFVLFPLLGGWLAKHASVQYKK